MGLYSNMILQDYNFISSIQAKNTIHQLRHEIGVEQKEMHTLSTTGKLVAFPKTPNPVPNGTAHIKQEHKADQKYSFQIKVIAPAVHPIFV